MKIVKPAGKYVDEIRKPTLHGSEPKRGMAKAGGKLQRLAEKPKGNGGRPHNKGKG